MKKIIVVDLMYVLCNFNNFKLLNKELGLLNTIYVSCKKINIGNDECDKTLKLDFSNLLIRPYFNEFIDKYKSKYNIYLGHYEDDILYNTYEQLKVLLNTYFNYTFTFVNLNNIDKSIKSKEFIFITLNDVDYKLTSKTKKIKHVTVDYFDYKGNYDIVTKIKVKYNITDEDLKNEIVANYITKNIPIYLDTDGIPPDQQYTMLLHCYNLRVTELELIDIKNDTTFKTLKLK